MFDQDLGPPPILPKKPNVENVSVANESSLKLFELKSGVKKVSKTECCMDHGFHRIDHTKVKLNTGNIEKHPNNSTEDSKRDFENFSVVNVLQNNISGTSVEKPTSCGQSRPNNSNPRPTNYTSFSHAMRKRTILRRFDCRILAAVIIATVCFLLGLAIPFIVHNFDRKLPTDQTFLGPHRSFSGVKKPNSAQDYLTTLNDVFITVKTTQQYHYPRLVILLETWVSLVKNQTWFFSDAVDSDMQQRTGGRIINTNCSDNHSREALACKTGVEYDYFLKSLKGWWCHFDDDNYVHVKRLAQLLKTFSSAEPFYLGKPSTSKPLEVFDIKAPQNTSEFWFATGGAGYCISRTLALKMAPFAADGKFVYTGSQFWFPDDVTLGYIIEHLLGHKLTVIEEFHSHLEPMKRIHPDEFDKQITFSYISYNNVENVIDLPGSFSNEVDPTRFYSLHCSLYNAAYCPDKQNS